MGIAFYEKLNISLTSLTWKNIQNVENEVKFFCFCSEKIGINYFHFVSNRQGPV